jgi:hypothetical protein
MLFSGLRAVAEQLLLIVTAWLGGLAFHTLHIPAPWVSGSMLAVGIGAMLVRMPALHPALRDAALLAAGMAMGAGVTPEAIRLIAAYPISFAGLGLAMLGTTYISAWYLRRFRGWNGTDAVLASVPGALSVVFAVASERRSDIAGIALVQNLRLLALVVLLPSAITTFGTARDLMPGSTLSAGAILSLALAGIVLGMILERLRLPAAMLMGSAIAGIVLSSLGLVAGRLPEPISIGGFLLIGVFTGLRLGMIDRGTVTKHVTSGVVVFVIGIVCTLVLSLGIAQLLDIDIGSVLLAFAPGGIEAMTFLALSLGADSLYVGTHHLVRFMTIGVLLPWQYRLSR